MSIEKPPQGTEPEKPSKKTENKEEKAEQEEDKKIASGLSPENKQFFEEMSEEGKEVLRDLCERSPIISTTKGAIERIALSYNKFWSNRHQEKIVELKGKMNEIDVMLGKIDASKESVKSSIETLKKRGIVNIDPLLLQRELQEIERRRTDLLNKRDKIQSKIEARENKAILYTNERDRIADKLAQTYEKKFREEEAQLEEIQALRDRIDLDIAVAEIKHKQKLAEIEEIKKKKRTIERNRREIGDSEEDVRKNQIIKILEEKIKEGTQKIRKERKVLAYHKREIDKMIAKIDARANKYRDKRQKFARIKRDRLIEIGDIPRTPTEPIGKEWEEEETRVHRNKEDSIPETPLTTNEEETPKNKERIKVSELIKKWNSFIKENKGFKRLIIDEKDFLEKAKGLPKTIELGDFKEILKRYLKIKSLLPENFNEIISSFYKKETKIREQRNP